MSIDPRHALTCVKLRRLAVTSRRDAIVHHLTSYATSNSCLARLVTKDLDSPVTEAEFHLPRETVLVDVSGTHPLAPSYRAGSHRSSDYAIRSRAAVKHIK